MSFIGEGCCKRVYQLDEKKVLKVFKHHVDIQKLRDTRLRAETILGDFLPKLYGFSDNGTVEEYCGRTVNACQFGIRDRINYVTFLIRAKLRHHPIDSYPKNFAVLNGKLKYIDWDGMPSEKSLSLHEIIDGVYFVLYENIKILERDGNFREIQNFYRENILPTIKRL